MEKTDDISFWETEEYKEYERKMEEKEKFIKKGSKVIHLEYIGGVFPETDILEYESKLESVGLELSRFDKNGVMYASLDRFTLLTFIAIAQPLIGELVKGVGTNATWDIIKYLLKSAWGSVRKRTYSRATSQEMTKKEISFGLKVRLDENTSFDFELSGDLDDKIIDNSLDKVLDFIGNQQLNKIYKRTEYVYYDDNKKKWIIVEVEKEISKMIKSGKLNKK